MTAAISLQAQVTLQGTISNLSPAAPPIAMIEYWNVDHWQQLSVIQLDQTKTYSIHLVPPVAAQCRIRLAGQNKSWSDFFIPGPGSKDSILTIDLDAGKMDGGPAKVKGSDECDRYYQLITANREYTRLRDSSSAAMPAQQALNNLNKLCQDIATHYRGTFTGDIVANVLYQPQRADYAKDPKIAAMTANEFAVAHDFDKIMFQYEGNMYFNGFTKSLNRYYNYFNHQTEEGSKNYIDGIMSRRNGNEKVDLFLFRYLLNQMMDEKEESGLKYLLTWYLPDCSDDSPLPDYLKSLIGALKYCEPGHTVDDLKLPGLDGADVSLADVCSKNKMTLMLFWKSTCSHCLEFKPVLGQLYEKYHNQGLEVYALDLDRTEVGWKTFLSSNPSKWVNVYIPEDERKEINKMFPVPGTPTLIALDRNRVVLSRLVLRDRLEAYLDETLPKLK